MAYTLGRIMKNPEHVVFQLREAVLHMQELASEIENGNLDVDYDTELEVHLGHILDHICYAWNAKDLTHEERMKLTSEESIQMKDGIPNFQISRRLFKGTIYEK